ADSGCPAAAPERRPQAHAQDLPGARAHFGLVAPPRTECGGFRACAPRSAPPHPAALSELSGGMPGGERNRSPIDDAATLRSRAQRPIQEPTPRLSAQSAGVRHLPLLARQRRQRPGQRLAQAAVDACFADIAARAKTFTPIELRDVNVGPRLPACRRRPPSFAL